MHNLAWQILLLLVKILSKAQKGILMVLNKIPIPTLVVQTPLMVSLFLVKKNAIFRTMREEVLVLPIEEEVMEANLMVNLVKEVFSLKTNLNVNFVERLSMW